MADAGHVAEASGVRLVIRAGDVPLSAVGSAYVANAKVELKALLTGGDDYQTLFTAPQSAGFSPKQFQARIIRGVCEALTETPRAPCLPTSSARPRRHAA